MYSKKQIRKLGQIELFHFWFKARQTMLVSILQNQAKGKKILDIGCGTGNLVDCLRKRGYFALGIDTQPNAPLRAYAQKLPFPNGQFDAAVMADVLEHIEDPAPALQEAFRVLAKDGILLITVPAFPWLWGQRDERAGHLRRYLAKDIETIAQKIGGRIVYFNYYQFFLFPLFALSRLCNINPRNEEQIPLWLNAIFYIVNKVEVFLSKWFRWPWGSSIIAVIQKDLR